MLNFRYHIVSLVAVFLALAIGVIMGSTVIDQTLVDRLETQQEQLRLDIEEARIANSQLEERVAAVDGYLSALEEETGDRLVADTLVDVPVLVLGVRGGEVEGLGMLVELLEVAGAQPIGELWFTERVALSSGDDRTELAEILEERPTVSAEVLRDVAVRRVTEELREAASTGDRALGAADDSEPSAIEDLLAAGYLEYEAPAGSDNDLPQIGPGTRAVLAVADVEVGALDLDLWTNLAEDLVDPERATPALPVVAVSSPEAGEATRSDQEAIAALRTAAPLSDQISTVDNLDQVLGRMAAVLALHDAAEGATGHFGLAEGATRVLPPSPPASADG